MRSHELARILLAAPDGEVNCSVDISTSHRDSEARCFGTDCEINHLPNDEGFGQQDVSLLFVGALNYQ